MIQLKRATILLVIFFTLGISQARAHGFPDEPTTVDLRSCENDFKYKGKFINPRLVHLFEGWVDL